MPTKAEIARDFVRKFPGTPHRTLARIMRKEKPDVFACIEDARVSVRNVLGAHGSRNRATFRSETYTPFARHLMEMEACIPEEGDKELLPVHIEPGRYLFIADAHIPEHSKLALETAIEHGVKNGCTGVIENGDMTEHARTSQHAKDPTLPRLTKELEYRHSYTKYVRSKFKGIYYSKLGNHEDNVRRYTEDHAPELAGLPSLSFESLMAFDHYGITCVPHTHVIQAGKLSVIHGHESGNANGDLVNPARWLSLRAKDCAVCSHFHRTSAYTDRRITGFETVYYSTGCLRGRTPDWKPLNNWNWGFGMLELADDGDFQFQNLRILSRGEVVPG
jgi:hypothetical protein